MNIDFNDMFKKLGAAVESFTRSELKSLADEAVTDAKTFLALSKDNIQRWSNELMEGKLTDEDFQWLIQSQKDLAKMETLKRAGLSLVRIDQFKQNLLHVVGDTVLGLIPH